MIVLTVGCWWEFFVSFAARICTRGYVKFCPTVPYPFQSWPSLLWVPLSSMKLKVSSGFVLSNSGVYEREKWNPRRVLLIKFFHIISQILCVPPTKSSDFLTVRFMSFKTLIESGARKIIQMCLFNEFEVCVIIREMNNFWQRTKGRVISRQEGLLPVISTWSWSSQFVLFVSSLFS